MEFPDKMPSKLNFPEKNFPIFTKGDSCDQLRIDVIPQTVGKGELKGNLIVRVIGLDGKPVDIEANTSRTVEFKERVEVPKKYKGGQTLLRTVWLRDGARSLYNRTRALARERVFMGGDLNPKKKPAVVADATVRTAHYTDNACVQRKLEALTGPIQFRKFNQLLIQPRKPAKLTLPDRLGRVYEIFSEKPVRK